MNKGLCIFYFLGFIFIFMNNHYVFAQDDKNLLEAKKYEEEKKIDNALVLYKAWAKSHPGHTDFFKIVKHIIQLDERSEEVLSFLYSLEPLCENKEVLIHICTTIAHIEELRGNLSDAYKYYVIVYNKGTGEDRFSSLLSAAQIYFQLGMTEKSTEAVNIILKGSKDTEIIIKSRILLSLLYTSLGELQKAQTNYIGLIKDYKTSDLYPVILLHYIEFLTISENKKEIQKIMAVFDKYFSTTPEYPLARTLSGLSDESKISFYPNPSSFLHYGNNNEEVVQPDVDEKTVEAAIAYIQTGSFLFKENADDMIKELLKHGFKAEIKEKNINDKVYYKVVIKVNSKEPEKINKLILSLKEAGFEGFLLL